MQCLGKVLLTSNPIMHIIFFQNNFIKNCFENLGPGHFFGHLFLSIFKNLRRLFSHFFNNRINCVEYLKMRHNPFRTIVAAAVYQYPTRFAMSYSFLDSGL